MNIQEFTDEQKQYLQGFMSGGDIARSRRGLPSFSDTLGVLGVPPGVNGTGTNGTATTNGTSAPVATPAPAAAVVPTGPDAPLFEAQNRTLAEGKKLVAEEVAKTKKHPLDRWDEIQQHSTEGRYPKGTDIFMFKYHGIFYVAPNQDSYMCRLRFHGGLVRTDQMRNLADITETYAGGYSHVTTRANLQIREIKAENSLAVLTSLQDSGIHSRGSGADNIRNVTGTPTAGIDSQELIDTRPLSKEMHYYIMNHREMYGLPRKFNIAFDGGGTITALEDTNDIGFSAVRVSEGKAVPAGVYFRMALGGITGHLDFAKDTGILLKPEQCVPMAAAVVRVFIDSGDRTDRKKARLKYVLDNWGLEKYMEEVQKHLSFEPMRLPLEDCEPRGPIAKHAHIGVHPQKQEGLYYIGVVLPVGKMDVPQMRGLADIADRYGSGMIRLTVWQNLLISDIKEADVPAVKQAIEDLGFHWSATNVRAGLIACTGSFGCRFANSDTKRHALAIADHVDSLIQIDQVVNIHLTGCPNSCAQHYIGDIGMLGTKVEVGEDEDMVEGYHMYVGGGYGEDQSIGRQVYESVTAKEAPLKAEKMLSAYMANRQGTDESFLDWTRRYSTEELVELFEQPR
jgi:ferredoxin-nitrite reductase